jgi:hypothetical protein
VRRNTIEFKSHKESADYIISKLSSLGIEAECGWYGNRPTILIPEMRIDYISPEEQEPWSPSWGIQTLYLIEDINGNPFGLYPEEVVEMLLRLKSIVDRAKRRSHND